MYNNNDNRSCQRGLTRPQSERAPTNERQCWQATKKPDILADEWAAIVGGQQKNQTLKGESNAAARILPFKLLKYISKYFQKKY